MTADEARQHFQSAKRLLDRAAWATLRGWPLAEVMAAHAIAELNAARQDLRDAKDHHG